MFLEKRYPQSAPSQHHMYFTAIKSLIFTKYAPRPEKSRPDGGCGPWLKWAPQICLKTFVIAYRQNRTELTKN